MNELIEKRVSLLKELAAVDSKIQAKDKEKEEVKIIPPCLIYVKNLMSTEFIKNHPHRVLSGKKGLMHVLIEFPNKEYGQSALEQFQKIGITAEASKFSSLKDYEQYKTLQPYDKMVRMYGASKVQRAINAVMRPPHIDPCFQTPYPYKECWSCGRRDIQDLITFTLPSIRTCSSKCFQALRREFKTKHGMIVPYGGSTDDFWMEYEKWW